MSTRTEPLTSALKDARQRTLTLISDLDHDALEAVHSPLLSPLVWDLGHIPAFEDLWIARTFGTPMVAPELTSVYDADETPRAERGSLPFLRTDDALAFMDRVRAHTLAVLAEHEAPAQDRRLELIIRHELQHNETMCQTLQIAGLPCGWRPLPGTPVACDRTTQWVSYRSGEVEIGADPQGRFAYDNEQPRHRVRMAGFRIARTPVSNAQWLEFIADGGYARRELWSEAGWQWRRSEAVERPLYWTADDRCRRFATTAPLVADEPVCHVSYFEAEAFARAHDARLPTEFEWEAAATTPPAPGEHRPVAMSPSVWQWTTSEFHGYPGFRADPYPEYSEQFFGHGYRVLRGGARFSSPRVATAHFRNWDHPQRRQIFSGLRLATGP